MVGDSPEDVETGNAAGTATAFISGGGNEVGGAEPAAPAPGAVPTFTVAGLDDLLARLAAGDTALGWGAYGIAASRWGSDSEGEEDSAAGAAAAAAMEGLAGLAGAPPPGMAFLDALFLHGAVRAAQCSFPRIDGTRFGVPPDTHPGDRVLHLECGDGALTKMLVSSGLQVGRGGAGRRRRAARGRRAERGGGKEEEEEGELLQRLLRGLLLCCPAGLGAGSIWQLGSLYLLGLAAGEQSLQHPE